MDPDIFAIFIHHAKQDMEQQTPLLWCQGLLSQPALLREPRNRHRYIKEGHLRVVCGGKMGVVKSASPQGTLLPLSPPVGSNVEQAMAVHTITASLANIFQLRKRVNPLPCKRVYLSTLKIVQINSIHHRARQLATSSFERMGQQG